MTKLSDASRANKSGIELEAELKNFLIQNSFVFRHQIPGQNEIDFIIGNEDNKLYADCTNQNSSGSVDEKIPHKIWKYYKKYNYSSVYIIRGSHKPRDLILEHCEEIAQRNNFNDSQNKEVEFLIKRFGLAKKVSKLEEIVKVDDKVPGCPMSEQVFLDVVNKTLKEFKII